MAAALNAMSEQKAAFQIKNLPAPKPRRINCQRAARLAGRSVSTIRRAIKRGHLRSFKVEGALFIFYRDLVEWLSYDPLDND